MMEDNRVFRPGKSAEPSSTFNIAIPHDVDVYISDSESDEPGSGKACLDKPCSDKACSDKPGSSSGSSSPSGSSTATIEATAGTPDGSAAHDTSTRPFAVISVGCQTPLTSILKNSRLSFSVTWASNEDETRINAASTDVASGLTGDADAAATTMRGTKKESPTEFLLRCPSGPRNRLEDAGKIARVAESCQHPVLACFMYTALAADAAIEGKQESPPAQAPVALPPGESSMKMPPAESPDVEPSVASSPTESSPVAASPVPPPVESPAVESASPAESAVASSAQSSVETPVEAPAESPAAGQPSEGQSSAEVQGQSLEGKPLSKGKVADPSRPGIGWGLAKGVAAVAVGIAIGAAFVSRRR